MYKCFLTQELKLVLKCWSWSWNSKYQSSIWELGSYKDLKRGYLRRSSLSDNVSFSSCGVHSTSTACQNTQFNGLYKPKTQESTTDRDKAIIWLCWTRVKKINIPVLSSLAKSPTSEELTANLHYWRLLAAYVLPPQLLKLSPVTKSRNSWRDELSSTLLQMCHSLETNLQPID